MRFPTEKNELILHAPEQGGWLHFQNPQCVVQTNRVDRVKPLLRDIEARARGEGLFAAGFLAYEAAPAFDPALQVVPDASFPLLWFALYPKPDLLAIPEAGDVALPDLAWEPSTPKNKYEQAIRHIKTEIARGRTYQVNYTLRLQAPLTGAALSESAAWAQFLHLVRAQRPTYGAFLDIGSHAICCASPELFFTLENGKLTSRPMKGTAPRGLAWEADQKQATWLHHSEKNRAENVMIVDMIRNDLGRVAEIGTVETPQLFAVEKYPSVWQMTSTVTARTQQSVTDVLAALFPCASITGAPKHSTMQIITALEQDARRIYTGSIGYMSPQGDAQFNVAIRTVLVDRQAGIAEYGVGGGVVWDSTDDGEWEECITKARILTLKHPSFELLETLTWRRDEGYVLVDYHLNRLARSADYFDYPLDVAAVYRRLQQEAKAFTAQMYRVRLLVAKDGTMRVQNTLLDAQDTTTPRRVCLAPAPVSSDDLFLYHKTTNRDVYERMKASCPEFDEVILWNERGEITEATTANVIMELDGERVTPALSSGLLAGVYRQWLLEQKAVRERVVRREDLQRCTGFWLVNSVRGEMPAELKLDMEAVKTVGGP